jgi:excinuclease ABC subunit C
VDRHAHEVDALILENELIKDNQPRYNMMLKDDKSFPYVALDTRTDFPVPYITRGAREGRALLRSLRRRARPARRRSKSC